MQPTPHLLPDVIYVGDNGRLMCERIHCAGSSAYHTGRDLSGHYVDWLTANDEKYLRAELGYCKCECGRVDHSTHTERKT